MVPSALTVGGTHSPFSSPPSPTVVAHIPQEEEEREAPSRINGILQLFEGRERKVVILFGIISAATTPVAIAAVVYGYLFQNFIVFVGAIASALSTIGGTVLSFTYLQLKSLSEATEQLQKTNLSLQNKVIVLNTEIANLQRIELSLKTEIQDLKTLQGRLVNETSAFREENQHLKEDIQHFDEENRHLQHDVDQLEHVGANIQVTAGDMLRNEKAFEMLKQKFELLEAEYDNLRAQFAGAQETEVKSDTDRQKREELLLRREEAVADKMKTFEDQMEKAQALKIKIDQLVAEKETCEKKIKMYNLFAAKIKEITPK